MNNSYTLSYMTDGNDLKPFIDIVREVRKELSEKYDVNNKDSKQYDYSSLCTESVGMVIEKIKRDFGDTLIVESFHGEQSRHPRLASKYWALQHDWCRVFLEDGRCVYIDPTSQQFQKYYIYIPDYIVSFDRPIWYMEDGINPSWNGWTEYLNQKIKIPLKVSDPYGDAKRSVKEGLVDFLQYEVWGNISDTIGKIMKSYK